MLQCYSLFSAKFPFSCYHHSTESQQGKTVGGDTKREFHSKKTLTLEDTHLIFYFFCIICICLQSTEHLYRLVYRHHMLLVIVDYIYMYILYIHLFSTCLYAALCLFLQIFVQLCCSYS